MVSAAFFVLCLREWSVRPDGLTHVHVLDIGQGDSIFIEGPSGQQVIVDGGRDLSPLEHLGRKMSFFDREIDLMILSHPNFDHMAAFPAILERYRVKAILMTGIEFDLPAYTQMATLIREQNVPVIIADPTKDINLGGGLFLDVIWPPPVYMGKYMKGDINDSSIVIKVVFGEDSLLLTGDMEEKEEAEVLGSGADIDVDILKVAHHGSRSSTSTGFLLAASPDLAVISVGRDNDYGHPHPWVMRRLEHFGVPVRTTAEEGTVTIKMDGKKGLECCLPDTK